MTGKSESWGDNGDIGYELEGVGDLDLDGTEDVAMSEYEAFDPKVWVLSGLTGRSLRFVGSGSVELPLPTGGDCFEFGSSIASIGDVDGDGRRDIAVGECGGLPLERSGPYGAWIFGSVSFKRVERWRRNDDGFGQFVAELGDMDRDGRAEIAVVTAGMNRQGVEAFSPGFESPLWGRWFAAPEMYATPLVFSSFGDVDADGVHELAISVRDRRTERATLHVLQGATGDTLWWRPDLASSWGRSAQVVSAGDYDGDGADDLWLLDWLPGDPTWSLLALSGVDGHELAAYCVESGVPYPAWVRSTPDLDGDGLPEIAIGSPGERGRGGASVRILAANDQRTLIEFDCGVADTVATLERRNGCVLVLSNGSDDVRAYEITERPTSETIVAEKLANAFDVVWSLRASRGEKFGSSLALLDDLDRDGSREFAICAIERPAERAVWVCRGATGARSFALQTAGDLLESELEQFGSSAAVVPDVDDDGFVDLAVGALDDTRGRWTPPFRVRLFSGGSGEQLRCLQSDEIEGFGRSVRGIDDIDGDGAGDVLVFARGGTESSVRCHSGRTGEFRFARLTGRFDVFAVLDDIDGDHVRDFIIDSSQFSSSKSTDLTLVSGRTGDWIWKRAIAVGDVAWRGRGLSAGDRNGDGACDAWLLLGCADVANCDAWFLELVSGRKGSVLSSFPIRGARGLAPELADIGDVDGDGLHDLAVRYSLIDHGPDGEIAVLSGADGHTIARRACDFRAEIAAAADAHELFVLDERSITRLRLRANPAPR